jgi:hypothetical protein
MALNIPSLQQLATPVTSGRRADLERQELRLMRQDEDIAERRTSLAESEAKKAEIQQARENSIKEEQLKRERLAEILNYGERAAVESLSAYEAALEDTDEGTAVKAGQAAWDRWESALQNVYGDEVADTLGFEWSPDSARTMLAQLEPLTEQAGKAQVFRDTEGNILGVALENTDRYQQFLTAGGIPGVEAGRPSQERQPEDDPETVREPTRPTAMERDQVETLVKDDERFGELDGSNRDKAVNWIVNRAKEVQRDTGVNFNDAIGSATDEAESLQRSRKDKLFGVDWLNPDDTVFDPSQTVEWNGESYKVGQTVTLNGKEYTVVGFDESGEPLVE